MVSVFVKSDDMQVKKRPHGGDLLLFGSSVSAQTGDYSARIQRFNAAALTAIRAAVSFQKKARRQEIPPRRTIDRYALCVVIVIFLREKGGAATAAGDQSHRRALDAVLCPADNPRRGKPISWLAYHNRRINGAGK